MIERKEINWRSKRLDRVMNIRVYGRPGGAPILVFPTQDAMSDNFENFGMIDAMADDLERGRIQFFCVDTVDAETWSDAGGDNPRRARRQEQYYGYIIDEVVPFMRGENDAGRRPVAAGCSLGALHAAIVFFRRPDLFDGLLALSGVYDAKFFTGGWMDGVLYDNSPLDFLSNMPLDHPYVDTYNDRRIVLCVGQGRWEEEGRRTAALMGDVLHSKDIRAWVDFWGYDVDHDWDWWKKQFPYFLPFVLREQV
ncbi:esterase family protein [Selenomonas sp. F0473]|uniref:esterase family protein n=1 Tax=Selenomonas sp. F0473 TaxID=999423 RepID=UPI00029E2A4D|nr:alpha/beta hydrolase-fold protein [Selenomonas sp. F0473]EKU70611.1 hypothetical protein HMPREF9161_01657 [Selenomonas sp. F0473]